MKEEITNFRKVLVANRGEIAVRIIRALRELGIKSVAVYSEADKDSLHLKYADEAFCIGSALPADSYLNLANIISTAEVLKVDAIHPGYGFLSEDATFAQVCEECKINFIGPSTESLKLISDKIHAKEIAKKAGLPLIAGTPSAISSETEAIETAKQIGYPVVLKTVDGGGGRGIRLVTSKEDLKKGFLALMGEAKTQAAKGKIYLEKYLENPRHIEVQFVSDKYGNAIFLCDRDCSIQRRNQKIMEEAPAFNLPDRMRKEMGEATMEFVKSVGYLNVGTVEYLVDKKNKFYFLEINPRIQVEHTVSEMVTGFDLVKWQVQLAKGEKINVTQNQTRARGHAIQCRINAEDPEQNFSPSPGKIENVNFPGGFGVRMDTHIYPGYVISPFYDSLLAKLICWGRDREEAILRLHRAIHEFEIEGLKTTLPFFHKVLQDEDYLGGNVSVNFVQKFLKKNF